MIVLVMGRTPSKRSAVAATLCATLGWEHVQVADEGRSWSSDRLDSLRAQLASSAATGRAVVYSCATLSAAECRTLGDTLRDIRLVRLLEPGHAQPPIPSALTLDGQMSPPVLAATIRAVLRLDEISATH